MISSFLSKRKTKNNRKQNSILKNKNDQEKVSLGKKNRQQIILTNKRINKNN